jgi:hypothetical protein
MHGPLNVIYVVMIRANIMHADSQYSLLPSCRITCSPMRNANRMGREILRHFVRVRFTHYAVASTSCHTRIVLCTPPPGPTLCLRHSVTLQPWQSHCSVCWKSVTVAFPSDYRTHARNLGYGPESVVRLTATVLGGS